MFSVHKPGCLGLRLQQHDQSVAGLVGVSDEPAGFTDTQSFANLWMEGKLTSTYSVFSVVHTSL